MASSSVSNNSVSDIIYQLRLSCEQKSDDLIKAAKDLHQIYTETNPEAIETVYNQAIEAYEKSLKKLESEVKTLSRTYVLAGLEDNKTGTIKTAFKQIDSKVRNQLIRPQPSAEECALQEELTAKNEQVTAIQEQLQATQARIQELEATAAQSDPSISIQIAQALSDLERIGLEEESARLNASLQELEAEMSSIQELLTAEQQRTKNLTSTNAQLQEELAIKNKEVTAIQEQLQATQARIQELEAAAAQSDPSVSTQIAQGVSELERIELEKAKEENAHLNASLQKLEAEISSIQELLKTEHQRTEQLTYTNAQLRKDLNSLIAQASARDQELETANSQLATMRSYASEQEDVYSSIILETNKTIEGLKKTVANVPLQSQAASSSSSSISLQRPNFLSQIKNGSSMLKKEKSWTREHFWPKLPKLIQNWKDNPQPHNFITAAQVMGWCSSTLDDLCVWMEASKNFSTKLTAFTNEEIDSRIAKRAFHKFLEASTASILNTSDNDDQNDWSDDEESVAASSVSNSINLSATQSISSLPGLGAGDSIYGVPLPSGGYARTISKTELLNRFNSKIDQIDRSIAFVNGINHSLGKGKFASLSRLNSR